MLCSNNFYLFFYDWEQRELREVANHRGGTAIEKYFDENGKYKVISIGSYGLDSQYIDQGIRAISNEVTDSRVVHKGELTMVLNDKTSNGTIIGRSLLINIDNEFVINQRTEVISSKENLDSSFAYVLLNGPFRKKVKRIVQGGTQIYVNYPAVERLYFELPPIDEQIKIGTFFSNLDYLITLHQRKLDKLKQLKQGYLQQLFPQNGEKFPRVRFINFELEWEERKLGNIGKVQSGVGFPETEQGGTQGIPFYKVSDMNNLGNETEMKNSNNYVNTEQIMRKKWKPVETVPAIIFAKVGAAIMLNRKRLVKHSFLIDNNTMAYIFYDSWDIKFGKTVFETINLPRYAQVGALPSYNGFDIESIVIKIPNISEQEKIGSFFKELDSYIILHQNKLNQLKTCKDTVNNYV